MRWDEETVGSSHEKGACEVVTEEEVKDTLSLGEAEAVRFRWYEPL